MVSTESCTEWLNCFIKIDGYIDKEAERKVTFSFTTRPDPLIYSGPKLDIWIEIQKSLLEGKLSKLS